MKKTNAQLEAEVAHYIEHTKKLDAALAQARHENVLWEIKFLEAHATAASARAAFLKATNNG